MYRSLDAGKIVETVSRLRSRIQERFPTASLGRVADDLLHVAEKAGANAQTIARPYLLFRIGGGALVLVFLAIIARIFLHLKISAQVDRYTEFFQGLDAALNTVILVAGSIFFLFTAE